MRTVKYVNVMKRYQNTLIIIKYHQICTLFLLLIVCFLDRIILISETRATMKDDFSGQFYCNFEIIFFFAFLLAHLSQRLTSELIGYPLIWRPSVSRHRRPSVHNFKHLLLQNCLANQSQILCGASLGRGDESLYKWSRSHDQDGRHAHIW